MTQGETVIARLRGAAIGTGLTVEERGYNYPITILDGEETLAHFGEENHAAIYLMGYLQGRLKAS